jgi:hypothetical protein
LSLSSQTMRKDFSESILLYGEGLKNWNEAYRLKLGEYVNPIAADKSPEFFPEREEPAPRDTLPPKIFVSFQGEYSNETPFAQMGGEVFFNIKASDETGVVELKSVSPRAENIGASGKLGPFGAGYISNPRKVASECGQEKELYREVEERKLDILSLVCACFEAKDLFGNSQKALSCFQREKIKTAVEFPSPQALVTGKDLLNGLPVKVHITSGVNLTSCEWWITDDPKLEPKDNPTLKGEGSIDSNTCMIENYVAADSFSNGEYRLVLVATDILGRSLSVGQFEMYNVVSFKILKDPPTVEMLAPKNGEFLPGNTIKVVGSFEDKESIKRISVSYKGVEDNNKDISGSFNVALNDPMNIWRAELGFNLPKGQYEVGLTVVDIYGNERVMKPRRIILDESRPAIAPVSHLISTTHISGYRQIFAQTRGDADRIEPIFSSRTNNGRAEVYRWSSEIFDEAKAPIFRFSINDDNSIKEIRYEIDDKCSSIEQAKVLGRNNGIYEVKILPRFSRTDLLSSKELCLSLWAVDRAGNTERKNILISWNVSIPPVSVHINSANFENERMNLNGAIWTSDSYNAQLNRGAEIGYAVITNQFSNPLEASLELEKPITLNLIVDSHGYFDKRINIPVNFIEIQYFPYDSQNDRVGSRIYPYRADRILADAHSSLVAKFVVKDDFRFQTFIPPELAPYFWFDFPRINSNMAAIKIKTADPRTSNISSYTAYYPKSPVAQRGYTR